MVVSRTVSQIIVAHRSVLNDGAVRRPWHALAGDISLSGAWGPCRVGWDDAARTLSWVGTRFEGGSMAFDVEVGSPAGRPISHDVQ